MLLGVTWIVALSLRSYVITCKILVRNDAPCLMYSRLNLLGTENGKLMCFSVIVVWCLLWTSQVLFSICIYNATRFICCFVILQMYAHCIMYIMVGIAIVDWQQIVLLDNYYSFSLLSICWCNRFIYRTGIGIERVTKWLFECDLSLFCIIARYSLRCTGSKEKFSINCFDFVQRCSFLTTITSKLLTTVLVWVYYWLLVWVCY